MIGECINWALKTLNNLGYQTKSIPAQTIVDTPWSHVARIETTHGEFYLKKTPKAFYLEVSIIKFLSDQFKASVPEIIADNTDLHCFLMKSAGENLRKYLKKDFNEALLFNAIEQFSSLQIDASNKVGALLEIGVPDYRLEKIPNLYAQLIQQKTLLTVAGLSDSEINQLQNMHDNVKILCDQLSGYGIKQTLVQIDFNDNNTLIDIQNNKLTMIDLGETVISHPFFSLLNFLHQIKKHHSVTEHSDFYCRLKDAAFKAYLPLFSSKQDYQGAIGLSQKINIILGIAYQNHFINVCGKENLIKHNHWKLGDLLKTWLDSSL